MADSALSANLEHKRRDVATRLDGATLDPRPTPRSLRAALKKRGARFIMEVKKRSPSGHRSQVSVVDAVDAYAPVADAISVLTDAPFFGGSLADLRAARAAFDGPILAKDFIVDPRQVAEARACGADAVLAIMAALTDDEAQQILREARRLNMDVVVEVHDEVELRRALTLDAPIIGVNNRNLRTLATDLSTTERLAPLVPQDRILISESGIKGRSDAKRLAPLVDAFLVGSALMSADRMSLAARELVFGPVKICGLTDENDVRLAAEAGATHAGFIFVPDSPRHVGASARDLVELATSLGLSTVGVFRDRVVEDVAELAVSLDLDAVQIHDDATDLEKLRAALKPEIAIWGLCSVNGAIAAARPGAGRTLFDTSVNGRSGGTGRSFDWKRLKGRSDLKDAFLAGGIGPDNVRAAQDAGAFGLDVGSAIETVPGRKDPARLRALFDALRPDCRKSAPCV